MNKFRKASKTQSRLRLALIGPSGSGKTYSALSIATHLGGPGSRIAVIDTEHGSASKFADEFNFDVLELGHFDPRSYVEAIQDAENEGFDVLIIDSLSHEWMGKGGALELVDRAAERSRSKNTFTAWKDVTPLHNALIDAIVRCRCHLIATMRAKTEYVLQPNGKGGVEPIKMGLGPVQRDGMEYEFDLTGDLTLDHKLIVTKTRCRALDGQVIDRPGKQVAEVLRGWLSDGAPAMSVAPVAPATQPAPSSPSGASEPNGQAAGQSVPPTGPVALGGSTTIAHDRLRLLIQHAQMTHEQVLAMLARRGVSAIESLPESEAMECAARISQSIEQRIAADNERRAAEVAGDASNRFPFEAATGEATQPDASGEAGSDADTLGVPDDASVPDATAETSTEAPAADDADAGADTGDVDNLEIPDQPRPESRGGGRKRKASGAAAVPA